MNKQEFLCRLREALSGFPQEDMEERIAFYSEMIDDSMEEGRSEEEAVASVGDVEQIISQILTDIPLKKIVKERIKAPRGLAGWEIVLLILGFPVWFPLIIAAFAVVFSLYVTFWAVCISLWSVFAALVGSAFGVFVAGLVFTFAAFTPTGLATIAAGFVCAGLGIFLFFGCKAATKAIALLGKQLLLLVKKAILRKENRHE